MVRSTISLLLIRFAVACAAAHCAGAGENAPIDSWFVTEYFGFDWPRQLVWKSIDELSARDEPLAVTDGAGRVLPAQLDPRTRRVYFIDGLPAGTTHRYHLRPAPRPAPSPFRRSLTGSTLQVENGTIGLRLLWNPAPEPHGADTGPIRGLCGRDGIWFGNSSFSSASVRIGTCRVVAAGPVFVVLEQPFTVGEATTITLTYRMDAETGVIRLFQSQPTGGPGAIVIRLGDGFAPDHAYFRAHRSTKPSRVYAIDYAKNPDRVSLSPLYAWTMDAGPLWACWQGSGRSDLVWLGAIRPSLTYTREKALKDEPKTGFIPPTYRAVAVRCGTRNGGRYTDISFPLQKGRKCFAIGFEDVREAGMARSGTANRVDRAFTRANGPGLDDYHQMVFDWPGLATMTFPRLWTAAGELDALRQTFTKWTWLKKQFDAHGADRLFPNSSDMRITEDLVPVGTDGAGAYLVTGTDACAAAAFAEIRAGITEKVAATWEYGPSTGANVGIALSRPWRSWVDRFDMIAGADAVSPEKRIATLRKLVFLAEVYNTDDAWPPHSSGVYLANPNFSPDVFSACGLSACLLSGHPKQKRWIDRAAERSLEFMEAYHHASGCSSEAPTYQFVSLSYLLQFMAALQRIGRNEPIEHPVIKQSLNFLAAIQTPQDPRCGFRMVPTIGHVTSYGWCQSAQAYFGWAAKLAAQTDPVFSTRMMAAWRDGGGFVFPLHEFAHNVIWSIPLCLLDPTLPAGGKRTMPRGLFPEFGSIMRTEHAHGGEGYLLFKMGESRGHYDADEGSVIWYAWGVPVLADFGTQYTPHLGAFPWLHNRISIDHRVDAWPGNGTIVASRFHPRFDYVCGRIEVKKLSFSGEWPRDRGGARRGVNHDLRPGMRAVGSPDRIAAPSSPWSFLAGGGGEGDPGAGPHHGASEPEAEGSLEVFRSGLAIRQHSRGVVVR